VRHYAGAYHRFIWRTSVAGSRSRFPATAPVPVDGPDLLKFMKSYEKKIYDNLLLVLSYFDDLAATGEVGGWPYYDELLEQVNSHDYS